MPPTLTRAEIPREKPLYLTLIRTHPTVRMEMAVVTPTRCPVRLPHEAYGFQRALTDDGEYKFWVVYQIVLLVRERRDIQGKEGREEGHWQLIYTRLDADRKPRLGLCLRILS